MARCGHEGASSQFRVISSHCFSRIRGKSTFVKNRNRIPFARLSRSAAEEGEHRSQIAELRKAVERLTNECEANRSAPQCEGSAPCVIWCYCALVSVLPQDSHWHLISGERRPYRNQSSDENARRSDSLDYSTFLS